MQLSSSLLVSALTMVAPVARADPLQSQARSLALSSLSALASSGPGMYSGGSDTEASVLEFENYGFSGYYSQVAKMSNLYDDDCTCEVSDKYITFSGANAPVDTEVSVHLRGPLVLNKFAYYTSSDFVHGDNSSSSWNRLAYYDAASSTAENATFLTKAGKNSTCLGKALTYAGADGTSAADDATVLAENTLINSNEEYAIFSNLTCGASGVGKACGVYRKDIPAYHGYYGRVKMFLFSFKMPNETVVKDTSVSNWNMPAVWLLNARVPRTSQYPTNANCSCWASGCGEFDIFEVLNASDASSMYSTIHDFQGTGDIETGLRIPGYMERDFSGEMLGGVAFDADGKAVVWLSNSTSFDSTISASDLNGWVRSAGSAKEKTLSSATASAPSGAGSPVYGTGRLNKYAMTLSQALFGFLLYMF